MSVRSVSVGIVAALLPTTIAVFSPVAITSGAAVIITKEPIAPFPFADLVAKCLKAGTTFFKVGPSPFYFSTEIQELRCAIALFDSFTDQGYSVFRRNLTFFHHSEACRTSRQNLLSRLLLAFMLREPRQLTNFLDGCLA
jgi:hypothetical protein